MRIMLAAVARELRNRLWPKRATMTAIRATLKKQLKPMKMLPRKQSAPLMENSR